MGRTKPGRTPEEMKNDILLAAAKSFLEWGYTDTSLRSIASIAEVNIGSLMNIFKTKEDILASIVGYVIDSQFETSANLLKGITDDKMLMYAAETVLQLHIVELNENLRDTYSMAYSLPKPSAIIQKSLTSKLEDIFKEHLPDLKTQDFFKLEIASGGIMRGFMTVPCDMWFTMEQKIESFLKTTFLIYQVPNEKIADAIEFVSEFDFKKISEQTIEKIMAFLEQRQSETAKEVI